MTDRGVSEALGFVIVFGIIITTVGLVYVLGVGGLEDARNVERISNAQRAFDVLGDNVEDITHGRAPSRATEVKLADATLRAGDPIRITVSGDHATDDSHNFSQTVAVTPLVFDSREGERIVYAAGAVMRAGHGGAVMQRHPDFVLDADHTVVVVPQTRPADGDLLAGSGTVLVRTEHAGTSSVVTESRGAYDEIWVNVTSPRAETWADHLSGEGLSCTVSGDTAHCSLSNVERVYVTVARIDVTFA